MSEQDFLSEVNDAIDNNTTEELSKTPEVSDDYNVVTNGPSEEIEKEVLGLLGDDDDEKEQNVDENKEKEKTSTEKENQDEKSKKEGDENNKTSTTDDIEKNALEDSKNKTSDDKKSMNPLDRFLKEDHKGNLVLADGTIIVASGTPRQFYESLKKEGRRQRDEAQKLALTNIQIAKAAQQLKKQYDELKTNPGRDLKTETGMNDTEIQDAVNFMRQYKQNPIQALKGILTQAQLNGIDISEIGTSGSLDLGTVKSMMEGMIKEQIGPIASQTEKQSADKAAIEEATQFLTENPEAKEYHKEIGLAREKYPDMSLNEIWLRLQLAMRNNQSKQKETDYNVVTNQQNQQQQNQLNEIETQQNQQQQQQRTVVKPKKDPLKMSFDEIAREAYKELQ